MSLCGKLHADVEMKAPAKMVHKMFHKTPHHVSNACGDKMQDCQLHEGDWGQVGSVICWNYIHGLFRNFSFSFLL